MLEKLPTQYPLNGARHVRGVSTCELSTTLAAVQRMVCRAYILVKEGAGPARGKVDCTDRHVAGRALAIHIALGIQGLVF